jgi:cell division protein FtsW
VPSPRKRQPDLLILFAVIALLGIGIVMVYSSSAIRCLEEYNDSYYFLKRQLVWAALGIVALIAASKIDYWFYRKVALWGLIGSFVLLVLVLVPGIGRVSHGARRSIAFGSQGVNPSEIVKLAVVIFFASDIPARKEKIQRLIRGLGPYLAIIGVACLLILRQPDLGTAISLAGASFVMLFCSGARISQMLTLGGLAIPVVFYAIFSEEYRRRRFLAFLDPWSDPSDSGYHIIQALYALGSGGLFGLGLGRGRQKFLYLPEAHTDFIFAIIGEELGFLGSACVIALFFFFAWRGYKAAITAPDSMSCLLATGVTSMVTVQALINIGVVTASLPITGIPLPFISYGGSSLVFVLAGVGILLNVSKYCQE